MKLKQVKNCAGMTLVELLAALTIMSIIVLAITGLMTQQLKSFDTTQNQVEVQENVRAVMEDIMKNIRVSSGASVEIFQDDINKLYNYQGNSSEISGNRLKINGFDYHLKTVDSVTKVYKDTSGNAPLTSPDLNITQLNFKGLRDGSISITITGVSTKEGSITYQLMDKIKPRID